MRSSIVREFVSIFHHLALLKEAMKLNPKQVYPHQSRLLYLKSGKGIYDYEGEDLESLERKINSSIIDQFKALGRMKTDKEK